MLKTPLLFLALIFFLPTAMGQEDSGILGKQAAPKKAPDWDAVEAVPLKAEDLLGIWHGFTAEKDYYSVWEIEYKEDGTYNCSLFDRMYTDEDGMEFEESSEEITGKWKISEDGILICTDDVKPGDEEFAIGPFWLKPIKFDKDKYSYLTVFPEEEDASTTVMYEFRGKAPKSLTDLPPIQPGVFKKGE